MENENNCDINVENHSDKVGKLHSVASIIEMYQDARNLVQRSESLYDTYNPYNR